MTIHKWRIPIVGGIVDVPEGTKFLDIQLQRDNIVIWGLCDPNLLQTERKQVILYNTGQFCNENIRDYLGTIQLLEGDLIKHIFIR